MASFVGLSRATTSASGMPSHSATLINPKCRLLPLPEHSNRCGPIFFECGVRSSRCNTAGVASKAARLEGPRSLVIRGRRGNLGADIRELVRRDQFVGLEQRQVGVQARIESDAVVLDAEQPGLRPVAEERQRAEQFTRRRGGARHVSCQAGQNFAGFHQCPVPAAASVPSICRRVGSIPDIILVGMMTTSLRQKAQGRRQKVLITPRAARPSRPSASTNWQPDRRLHSSATAAPPLV